VNNDSDISAEIPERIRRGDQEAFSLLFRQYYEPLCYFAQRLIGDFDGAEGIVQDVFVRLWDTRESLSIHTSLRSYLYTAVKNSCLNQIKRARFSTPIGEDEDRSDATTPLPDEKLESDEVAEAIQRAIAGLPLKCRQIFCLAKFDGLSYQEIAEIQNVSVNTVKTQLKRALKSLSSSLHYLRVLLAFLRIL
jgi:RNA polymerase sigma-70 factor, ECF subfamily